MGGMSDMGSAMSMGAVATAGQQAPMGGAHGGGLLGSMGMGGDLLSNSEFELNRESRGGILSLWSRSSRSYFTAWRTPCRSTATSARRCWVPTGRAAR